MSLNGKQNAGYYRHKIGSFELTVVTDGVRVAPLPDNFVRNASQEQVGAALQAVFLPPNQLTSPYNPLVVNTGSRLVLIDAGLGATVFEQSKGALGQLAGNLSLAGIDAKAIDTVIVTHCHPDHINGLLDAEGKPAFPNAEVFVPDIELKFWSDDGALSRAPEAQKAIFANNRRVYAALSGKLTPYEGGKDVVGGISAVASPGHTPGQMSLVVASGSETLFVQADVTNVPYLFARNPGWHAMFDMDGPLAEATRRRVYDMLVAERMPMQGFHYPFPSFAHVEKSGSGYREVPVIWNPSP